MDIMKTKYKKRKVYRPDVILGALLFIILPFLFMQIEEFSGIEERTIGFLYYAGIPLILFVFLFFNKLSIDVNGIEHRTLLKKKSISWDEVSHIKVSLRYNFNSGKEIFVLVYKKNNTKPYFKFGTDLIEIPIIEIKENGKPNSRLRRLLLVKRHKLMVNSKKFKETRFFRDVKSFAQHIKIEESVAYT